MIPVGQIGLMIAAIAAGAVVPLQAGANAALGKALGHPLWATLASLGVSILAIVPLLILMAVPPPSLPAALKGPGWVWIGGLAGAFYVTAALLLAPRLGASAFLAAVVAGQIASALVLDHFGLMGFRAQPVTAWRLLGAALIVAGLLAVQAGTDLARSRPDLGTPVPSEKNL